MFSAPGTTGRVGFITPSHAAFCSGCDKLRLSSRGLLRTCLYAKGGTDLRPMLRAGDEAGVRHAVAGAIERKAAAAGREGCEVASMIGIGG
jgi:cyclic pyranopterin phosphate synthase